MADETNQQNDSGESPNVKQMRETIERLQEQNSTYESALRLSAFKEAGINPEKGIGKAIYRTYEGEIDPDNIAEFAKNEYDFDPAENAGGKSEDGIPASQQRTQQAMQAGRHEDPPSALDKANEAAKKGDWVTSAAMKDRELMNVAEGKFSYGR